MGLETDLEICFSAVNPPVTYQTAFIDIPLASRFCMVQVPSFSDFDDKVKNQILNKGETNGHQKLRKVVSQAKKRFTRDNSTEIDPVIIKIIKDLKVANVNFSGRQARDLKGMFVACKALNAVSEIAFDTDTLCSIAISNIPEVNGITRSNVETQQTYGIIHTVLQGFKFNDPMIVTDSIEDLTRVDLKKLDLLDWMATLKKAINEEQNVGALKTAVIELDKKKIDRVIKNKIISSVGKIMVLKENGDKSITEILFK
jgi:hypothetical protein